MTVTSQQRGLPSCRGIRDRPSGLLPSDLDRPLGSLVTGMPADTNARATSSLRAWCLAVLPEAVCKRSCVCCMRPPVLHTDTDVVRISAGPDRNSVSSLRLRLQEAIGWAKANHSV